jgi:hypothetical protein
MIGLETLGAIPEVRLLLKTTGCKKLKDLLAKTKLKLYLDEKGTLDDDSKGPKWTGFKL